MLQARMRGEKQWYRPDRDLLNALKPLMIKTLEKFSREELAKTRSSSIPESEYDRYVAAAGEVAKLFNHIADRNITEKELSDELDALTVKYPYVMAAIVRQFFVQTLLSYNRWVLETVPETEDGKIDVSKFKPK